MRGEVLEFRGREERLRGIERGIVLRLDMEGMGIYLHKKLAYHLRIQIVSEDPPSLS